MKTKNVFVRCAVLAVAALALVCLSVGAASAETREELTAKARASLDRLYSTTPEAKELRGRAVGVLVFPDILKAGLIVGGSGGNGVLFASDGRVLGYYNAASLSFGLQAGAENFSEAMIFVSSDALKYLEKSDGWSIGAGPNVVLVDAGMAKDLSSTTLRSDVYAFIYAQKGLMGGIGIQGQKITKLNP